MNNLNKKLITLIVTLKQVSAFLMMAGCTNHFLKTDDDCHFVIETTYSQPVVCNLDYALIMGFQNQAVIEPSFQHALTLPSRLQPTSVNVTTRPVQSSEQENVNVNTVYFAFDSITLSDPETEKLNRFISQNAPRGILHIKITGHTDSYGSTPYNQRLSMQRAEAVKQYLINKGVKASLISTLAFGEQAPAAVNSTESGRALNRRSDVYPVTSK
ncbi:OmpA family protein [Methylovulum psychrotolerans]|uniref:OmpA family protein n=1 Tax=Methylovulum psychrotolerans TaxID=1704499 RepID=A0A2S5CIK3_9GAMM|nr:OmpA family protein [Methylovulum psychrotolerans]POZ50643.1 OmpA family protein [Methylovulum psychrotolerans]